MDSKSFLAFFARCGEEANEELEMLSEEVGTWRVRVMDFMIYMSLCL